MALRSCGCARSWPGLRARSGGVRIPRFCAIRADLANHLLAVEFHGYHSENWQALPVTLPSQLYTFSLVEGAMGRGAVIVVLRAWRE